jgi:hypothetical protein
MAEYEFAFEVEGFHIENPDHLDALYETFEQVGAASQGGRVLIDFVITANGAYEALTCACEQLEAAIAGVRVIRLDRDLVAIPDIADRVGRTPESVRLLVLGKRGPGYFPSSCGTLGGGTRVWEWATVARWFAEHDQPVEDNTLVDHEMATLFDASLLNRYPGVTHSSKVTVEQSPARRSRSELIAFGVVTSSAYDKTETTSKRAASAIWNDELAAV